MIAQYPARQMCFGLNPPIVRRLLVCQLAVSAPIDRSVNVDAMELRTGRKKIPIIAPWGLLVHCRRFRFSFYKRREGRACIICRTWVRNLRLGGNPEQIKNVEYRGQFGSISSRGHLGLQQLRPIRWAGKFPSLKQAT